MSNLPCDEELCDNGAGRRKDFFYDDHILGEMGEVVTYPVYELNCPKPILACVMFVWPFPFHNLSNIILKVI